MKIGVDHNALVRVDVFHARAVLSSSQNYKYGSWLILNADGISYRTPAGEFFPTLATFRHSLSVVIAAGGEP
jgi:hypothetical protein